LTQSEDYQTAFVRITELIDYIMQDKAIVYGYFDKKELAGFIWVFPYEYRKEERYLLNAITVLPEYRKKHIASRLFESVENEICGKKTALFTFVDVVNEKGRHFYQRHIFYAMQNSIMAYSPNSSQYLPCRQIQTQEEIPPL